LATQGRVLQAVAGETLGAAPGCWNKLLIERENDVAEDPHTQEGGNMAWGSDRDTLKRICWFLT
jgi:hypothetical protein